MSGTQNSHIELLLGLYRTMFDDLNSHLCSLYDCLPIDNIRRREAPRGFNRDVETLSRRINNEGLQFATIRLPKLGGYVDYWLEHGTRAERVEGFHPYDELGYPVFMQDFWRFFHAFTADEFPEEYKERSLRVIRIARSIFYSLYKLEGAPSADQLNSAYQKFVENDEDCGVPWTVRSHALLEDMGLVLEEVLEGFDPKENIRPKHGPGAVATGERLEGKWCFTHFYPRLHAEYPYYEYMYGIRNGVLSEQLRSLKERWFGMIRDCVPTSKVVAVPKDSRGPRIICAEPLEIQFIQQGVARNLVRYIERESRAAGQVNFTRQEINQRLALRGSADGSLCTLDMKDASDLVSLELFRAVWPKRLFKAFMATRSTHANVPNYGSLELKKYAPMGSALCFPVESLIFYACCVSALIREGVAPSVALRLVHVYGDDLVVPTTYAEDVIVALESIGLRVNNSKCCYRSKFRESCGVDAYDGVVITPQRIRKLPGLRPSDGAAHSAWLSYASNFWSLGMTKSSMYCLTLVESVLGDIPVTAEPASYLSAVIPDLAWSYKDYKRVRWNAGTQSLQAYVWTSKDVKRPAVYADPYDRLLANLLVGGEDCDLSEVVVPKATKIIKRWRNIYAM